jgi:hypothetical protein
MSIFLLGFAIVILASRTLPEGNGDAALFILGLAVAAWMLSGRDN